MSITQSDAVEALNQIGHAAGKVGRLKAYRHSGVYFIIWGLVWLGANLATHLRPDDAGVAWMVAIAIGFAASLGLGVIQNRRRAALADGWSPPVPSWKVGLTSLVYFGFFVCLFAINAPQSGDQANATISIFFAFAYMAGGVWLGWRLFAIGLVTAAAIMGGFYLLPDMFSLWMGVVGGGALIAGGLWLRSA